MIFTDEIKKRIKDLYSNTSMSYTDIALEIGTNRKSLSKVIERMIQKGELVKRKPVKKDSLSAWQNEKIIELYNAGLSYVDIAQGANCSKFIVSRKLADALEKGIIEKRPQPTYNRKKPHKVVRREVRRESKEIYFDVDSLPKLEEPIKCSLGMAKTCRFGCLGCATTTSKCNFMGVTGHSRIVVDSETPVHVPMESHNKNYTLCRMYQKVTRENKRYKSKVEM